MATDDKYDRQIRLWGAHGQRALMEAKLCVLGSTACATETLKNLVLPGIGHFTVVDNQPVQAADLGQNFFLEEEDMGRLRAEAVCGHLLEMNPDVKGTHVGKAPAQAVAEGVDFFRDFTLVVACQLGESSALRLDAICQELDIPLLLVTSLGFLGRLRISVGEHAVCETKPDSEFGDLRLTAPFPELRSFVDSIDFASLSDIDHAHVPYVVILIQALDVFRKETAGKPIPQNKEDKDRFKDILQRMKRQPEEQNFQEALDNAYKAWVPYSVPDPMQQVLELRTKRPKADFWVVARAVAQFVRDSGKLPLAGTLPDMTASTDLYVKLQEAYIAKANADCATINNHVALIQKELGLTSSITPEYVKRFCQNAQYCEVFRCKTLEEEYRPISSEEGGIDFECEVMDEDSLIQWYIALRAADRFREEHGHLPGSVCDDGNEAALAADVAALSKTAAQLVESYKVEGISAEQKHLEEVVRAGGAEIHCTSSVMGGITSQEAVKLVTKQYSPNLGVLLYDGLHGKMQSLPL
eukprot:TRINITY_DN5663_c0_g1_i1.p1 TRINITY_DN5663_c0_g1~~TRINITY_DN5663_c0_g1_i1.p1  ORF type:complete len:525 (+),score=118.66 TRINITY_DN5663_c0_g1_i1:145-1719(+)